MEWNEKIKKGMELIGEGCFEEGGWSTCRMSKCPFGDYCWAILRQQNEEQPDLLGPWYWDKI